MCWATRYKVAKGELFTNVLQKDKSNPAFIAIAPAKNISTKYMAYVMYQVKPIQCLQ